MSHRKKAWHKEQQKSVFTHLLHLVHKSKKVLSMGIGEFRHFGWLQVTVNQPWAAGRHSPTDWLVLLSSFLNWGWMLGWNWRIPWVAGHKELEEFERDLDIIASLFSLCVCDCVCMWSCVCVCACVHLRMWSMHVCACVVRMHMLVHVHVCMHVQRPEGNLRYHPQKYHPAFLRQGLLLNWSSPIGLVWLASGPQESSCLHFPSTRVIRTFYHAQII